MTNLEKNLSESRLQLQSELELRSQILDEKDVMAKEKESLLKVKLDQTMEIERLRTRFVFFKTGISTYFNEASRHSLAEAKIEVSMHFSYFSLFLHFQSKMLQGRLEEQASMTHLGRKAYDDIQARFYDSLEKPYLTEHIGAPSVLGSKEQCKKISRWQRVWY